MSRAPAPPRAVDTIHQPAIDQALGALDRDRQRLAHRLGVPAAALPSPELLRAGPLGQDLRRLALVADGRIREPEEGVLSAIASVLGSSSAPPGPTSSRCRGRFGPRTSAACWRGPSTEPSPRRIWSASPRPPGSSA